MRRAKGYRKALEELVGKRARFTAVLKKRNRYLGHIMLADIQDSETGVQLTDHAGFRSKWSSPIPARSTIAFDARIVPYVKGRSSIKRLDYRLERPTRVEELKKRNRYLGHIMLADIQDSETGVQLTDHVWFQEGKWSSPVFRRNPTYKIRRPRSVQEGKWSSPIPARSTIAFDARIVPYVKGRSRKRLDYRLERPTRVEEGLDTGWSARHGNGRAESQRPSPVSFRSPALKVEHPPS